MRRSLLLTAPRNLEWVEEALPDVRSDGMLVRTDSGAVSVGSELPAYLGTELRSSPAAYPRMTGYESVGTVVECGSGVEGFRDGDRVVGFYGHRTYGVVSEERILPVPDGISEDLALLAILSCDVSKGIRRMGVRPEEPTLVAGAGAIGLLTLAMLRAYGASSVDVFEPDEHRRSKAEGFGARAVMAPEEMAGSAETYSVGFECSGRDAAFAILQRKLRPGGRASILSDGNVEVLSLAPEFHEKELSVAGSSDGWGYGEHARWYFDLLGKNESLRRNLESLFELRTSAEDPPETFERLSAGEISPPKVLVEY